ncbi:MAG: AAA family ATPase [Piscinibacter sp.]
MVLRRETLKSLRRLRGQSQEQVALECAERGLCVSIASLKRAERSASVLYRTARDLARFYDVELAALIEPQESAAQQPPPAAAPGAPTASRRTLVALQCRMVGDMPEGDWLAREVEDAARLFDAGVETVGAGEMRLLFGLQAVTGKEIGRALACAFRLQSRTEHGAGRRAALACALAWIEQGKDGDAELTLDRLAAAAPGGAVLATSALRRSAPAHYRFEPFDPSQPVEGGCWRAQPDPDADGARLALVGRRVEVQQFRAALESVQAYGDPQVVGLRGVAGIGKSRLLEEFARLATLEGFECHVLTSLELGAGGRSQLPAELARRLLGTGPQDGPAVLEARLAEASDVLAPGELALMRGLLQLPLPVDDARLIDLMQHETRIEAQAGALAALAAQRSATSPLMLAVEDVHWSGEQEQQLLAAVLSRQTGPVLWVLTARPGERALHALLQHAPAETSALVLELAPLPEPDARALADQIVGADGAERQVCLDRAQGHPLLLESLLRDGSHGPAHAGLPRTVQLLAQSRLDQLEEADRQAVRAAAVLGAQFELEALRALISQPDYSPEPLLRSFLVRRRGARLAFCHALIHEGIYESLLPAARSALHAGCAQWFAGRDGVLQAHHLLRAEAADAPDAARAAAHQLIERYQFGEAIGLLDAALAAAPHDPLRFELLMLRATACMKGGDVAASVQACEAAAGAAPDRRARCDALIERALGLNTLERIAEAEDALDEAGAIAAQLDLPVQASRVHYLRGNFHFPRGDAAFCHEQHRLALQHARRAGNAELEARACSGLGDAAYAQGRLYSAYTHFSDCLALCRAHGLLHVQAANLFMLGTVRIYQNENLLALDNAEQSVALAERVGHRRAQVVSHLTAGWVLLDLLELERASSHIERGLALAESIGARRFVPFLRESLARLQHLRGEPAAARASIVLACEEVDSLGLRAFIGPWLLGTRALLAATAQECDQGLRLGESWLDEGCIGHNHFRFAAAAIAATLARGDTGAALHHARRLADYTRDEPTPWSRLHIEWAEAAAEPVAAARAQRLARLADAAAAAGLRALLPHLQRCAG